MRRRRPRRAQVRSSRARSRMRGPKSKDARRRALEVLSLMRNKNISLTKAAREALTTGRTVTKYVKSALRKDTSRRWKATPNDRLTRHLRFLTGDGQIVVTTHSSRAASKVAEYWAAVDHYLRTGSSQRLEEFKGRSLRTGREQHPYITDLSVLDRIASVGEVTFEDLYPPTK